MKVLRSRIFHTRSNAFHNSDALVALHDGGLAIENDRVAACGEYRDVIATYPDAEVRDLRAGFILPGFVDTHVHFPQVRIIGGLGYSLLDWLRELALPEEAGLADTARARTVAGEFVRALAVHGTTTALVFGSHFVDATAALFDAAASARLRIVSGLVMSDRNLLPVLHQTPGAAYDSARSLVSRFHGKGRLHYAVTPRFALSASEAMLDVCGTLVRETPDVFFTTHINENQAEIGEVARLFPGRSDYLAVYEHAGVIGRKSVLAHNVHPTEAELGRLERAGASVAHCPCSNAALGSGIFPMRRHLAAGVRFALGTDIGAGTGFSIAKEALQSYLQQRVAENPLTLTPAQMLYLATRAGAEALAMDDEFGDFERGKSADLVYLEPKPGSVLAGAIGRSETPTQRLAALFTLADRESIAEVQVGGEKVGSDS